MFKKDDFLLEYVYHKKQFRRAMWTYVAIWAALRIARAILYFTVGIAFLSSIPATLIFWASGLVFGLAIMTIIIYRRSVRVDDLDQEVARLKK
jgi:formate/nitrite transporter FocA (FNT family)